MGALTTRDVRSHLPSRHNLNRLLLKVLARLTGDACLAEYAKAWRPDRLSPLDRAEIYLVFLWTKNMCRGKYRTWVHTSVMDVPKSRRSANSQLSPQTKLAG